jgi:glutamine amidotransferase
MCRVAAYLGTPAPLSALLTDPPFGLSRQAWAPRQQTHGNVNVDGTGVAWWRGGDPRPLRYVTERPPWSDPNLEALAPRLLGRLQLAAVRSATPGMAYGPAQVAPFVHGGLAAVHNGFLGGYRGPVGRAIVGRLPDDLYAAMDVVSDSLAVLLTVAARLRKAGEPGLPAAVAGAVGEVTTACAAAGQPAAVNLVVADGTRLVAVRAARGVASSSLHVLTGGGRWPGGVVVASEPLDDDPGWWAVPDDRLVVVEDGEVTVADLDQPPTRGRPAGVAAGGTGDGR